MYIIHFVFVLTIKMQFSSLNMFGTNRLAIHVSNAFWLLYSHLKCILFGTHFAHLEKNHASFWIRPIVAVRALKKKRLRSETKTVLKKKKLRGYNMTRVGFGFGRRFERARFCRFWAARRHAARNPKPSGENTRENNNFPSP